MDAAVALVNSGGRVSVRKAAQKYGLPKSTVHRYVKASRVAPRTGKQNKACISYILCDESA